VDAGGSEVYGGLQNHAVTPSTTATDSACLTEGRNQKQTHHQCTINQISCGVSDQPSIAARIGCRPMGCCYRLQAQSISVSGNRSCAVGGLNKCGEDRTSVGRTEQVWGGGRGEYVCARKGRAWERRL